MLHVFFDILVIYYDYIAFLFKYRENRPCKCIQSDRQTTYECGSDLVGKKYCPNPCKKDDIYCGEGRHCISSAKKCNSDNDCENWVDENNCTIMTSNRSKDSIIKNTVLKVDGKGTCSLYNFDLI